MPERGDFWTLRRELQPAVQTCEYPVFVPLIELALDAWLPHRASIRTGSTRIRGPVTERKASRKEIE